MSPARISRRTLMKGALGGAVAAGLSAAAMRQFGRAGGAVAKVARAQGYIDIHAHLGQTWNTFEPLTADVLLRWMDEHDIAQAVVLPLVSPESSSYLLTNDFVLAETKPFRDRLIPFCAIDPRTSHSGEKDGFVDMLKRWVDLGAKGFGEHKPGVAIDSPLNMTIYAACAELKLPVLFHLDNERNMDKPGLPGLERVLKENPECVFIGHGLGWWASISGDATQADLDGYPEGKIAPGGAVDRLMRRYPNLFADLSAGSGANAMTRDLDFGQEFLVRWQDRVCFGTDFLTPGQDVPQFDLFENRLTLPDNVREKITWRNAQKLLGIAS